MSSPSRQQQQHVMISQEESNKENTVAPRPFKKSVSFGGELIHSKEERLSDLSSATHASRFEHGIDVLNEILSGSSAGGDRTVSAALDDDAETSLVKDQRHSAMQRRHSSRDVQRVGSEIPNIGDILPSTSSEDCVSSKTNESLVSANMQPSEESMSSSDIQYDIRSDGTDSMTTDGSMISTTSTLSTAISTTSTTSSRRRRRAREEDEDKMVSKSRYRELKIENSALKRELQANKSQYAKETEALAKYKLRAKQKMEKLELKAKESSRLKSQLASLKRELDELRVAKANADLTSHKRQMDEKHERREAEEKIAVIRRKLDDLQHRLIAADIQILHTNLRSQFAREQEPRSHRVVEDELDWNKLTITANDMLNSVITEAKAMYDELMSYAAVQELHGSTGSNKNEEQDSETNGIIVSSDHGPDGNENEHEPRAFAQAMYLASLSVHGVIVGAEKQQSLNDMTAEYVSRIQRKHEQFIQHHSISSTTRQPPGPSSSKTRAMTNKKIIQQRNARQDQQSGSLWNRFIKR